MTILIIQNEISCSPGTTLEWCQTRQLKYEIIQASHGIFPDLSLNPLSYKGIIILGGSMNVDEENLFPWLKKEKEFLRNLVNSSQKTLGICLGGQLLAETLGARVSKHSFSEQGWRDIEIKKGFTLPQEGKSISVMQWHHYIFELPLEAQLIFRGQEWKNQGFIYKDFIMGTQFHPEADLDFLKTCYQSLEQEITIEHEELLKILKNWYFQLLDFFFLNRIS